MKNMYSFIRKLLLIKGNCAIKQALGGGRIHLVSTAHSHKIYLLQ